MGLYEKNVDILLNLILQDIENQLPDVDRATGSLVNIQSAAIAAALWGHYSQLDNLARQIFPDSASSAILEKHAAQRGIPRLTDETDSALLTRLLTAIRQPPAGGNRYDWPRWAKEMYKNHTTWMELCTGAWLHENARGLGTINLAIASNRSEDPDEYSAWANTTAYVAGDVVTDDTVTGEDRAYVATTSGTSSGTGVADDTGVVWEDCEEYASSDLVTNVNLHVDTKRPVGTWDYEIYPVLKKTQAVSMIVTGSDVNVITVKEQIQAFMKSLVGGKGLYVAQLVYVAIEAGADNATVSVPAADVAVTWGPTSYQRIWPGQITVGV
jgi:hypothetical protein